MFTDTLPIALTSLAAVTILAHVTLKGWQGWLALRAQELDLQPREIERSAGTAASTGARIEIADLKERIRKLEAIAAGVDL